jgi:hypothetical protein
MQMISDRFIQLNEFYPQEKLYIHTDKSHYLPGETIWFKLYLTDASSHEDSPHSRIVYVELADTLGMVVDRRYIPVFGGQGQGDFLLAVDFESGSWILRGFTNYMLNYSNTPLFSMEIKVMDAFAGISGHGSNRVSSPERGLSTAGSRRTGPGFPSGTSRETGYAGPDEKTKTAATSARSHQTYAAGFSHPVKDPYPSAGLNVSFFPEGGDLVGKLGAVVAVHATETYGRGVELHGHLYDDFGKLAGRFATGRFGLGKFEFTPGAGRKYFAEVIADDTTFRFELFAVKEKGYTLQVNNSMPDKALVRVETNMEWGLQNALLIGHIRGQIFCLEKLQGDNIAIVNIDKIGFPAGIAHFTLFSAEGLPLAERLTFIGNDDTMAHLDITATKETYGNRERVEIELELLDNFDYPLGGNLSVSVTDSYVVPSHHDHHNIVSYLLLSSELPGTIENPGYFFDPSNADRHIILDLLMLTHGWRRFRWEDLLTGDFPEIRYPAGRGHIIEGRVTRKDRHDVPVRSSVMLAALGEEFSATSQVTDENGLFLFDEVDLYDTTILMLQGSVYREKRAQRRESRGMDDSFTAGADNWISFHLSEPDIVPGKIDIPAAVIAEQVMLAYIEDSMKDLMLPHLEDLWQLEIEEVEIQHRRPVTRTTFDRAIHGAPFRPRDRIIPDEYPFSDKYHNPWELIRALSPSIILSDIDTGIVITQQTSLFFSKVVGYFINGSPCSYRDIRSLPIETISFVDILREPQTNLYGMGYHIVIAVFQKTVGDYRVSDTHPTGIISLEFPGYYQAREFYSPRYDIPGTHHDQDDYRTTLFWDPEILIDENGKAKVSFFTSDKSSAFRVVIEGVTHTGIPVYTRGEFRVDTDSFDH